MSTLRDMAEHVARGGAYPTPYATRRPHTEKLAELLRDRPLHEPADPESWDDFLHRIGIIDTGLRHD